MCLDTHNNELDLIQNIFKEHPMWNYKYYAVIYQDIDDRTNPTCVGFKNILLANDKIDKYTEIDEDVVLDSILEKPDDIKIICKNGLTHDESFNELVQDIKINSVKNVYVLILKVKKLDEEFKDRLVTNCKNIKTVKFAWVMKKAQVNSLQLKGFDNMSNEIIIDSMNLRADEIKIAQMTDETAEKNAIKAVSKLF